MEQKQLLLVKAEVTYGEDPVLAAADVVWAEDVSFTPKGTFDEGNPAMAGLGGVKGETVGEYGELTFMVPLAGSGVAGTAPKFGKLLIASGWSEALVADTSVTYSLAADPSAAGSVAITWREGRRKHVLLGARGFVGFTFDELKRPMIKYTFRGLRTNVADGAVIAHGDATWTGWKDAIRVTKDNTVFNFNATTPPLRSYSVDQSDNVVFADRPNQKLFMLAGARTFSGKAKISSLLPSVLNIEALKSAATLVTASVVHGTVAGSIVTLTTKQQINSDPTYSNDKGVDVTDFGVALKPSALGVDDQVALVLT